MIYGDLRDDGREDALGNISCGPKPATYSESEILIYSAQEQQASLIARLDDSDLDRAYKRHKQNCLESDDNPSCGVWGGIRDVHITGEQLIVESLAEGYHAGPKYVVRSTYQPEGGELRLAQKPQKRPFEG